jgi:polyribonucleotide nucleotidyltransferase
MVEGEMKEISEAEMLEAIFLARTHQNQISAQLRLQAAFERKKFVPTTEKEKTKRFKAKAALMIKFMQLQRQVQLNTNAQQHLQRSKKKLKLYLLKKN